MDREQVTERIRQTCVVPVATIEAAENAASLAAAMLAGGIGVIEVTLRTAAALDAIRSITGQAPDMLTGAGTVMTVAQCEQAHVCGAQFIVSPGFHPGIAQWCNEHDLLYVPGCVTPTEITAALEYGIQTIKYFPSNCHAGLTGMKALSGPFPQVSFIPTCGLNEDNVAEFVCAPFVLAAGGSWVCPKGDIDAGNFERITELCRRTKQKILGYELYHIGLNYPDSAQVENFCQAMEDAFGFAHQRGNSSDFSSERIEVKKGGGRGTKGHLGIGTNSIYAAMADLSNRGYDIDESSAVYKNGKLIAVYLSREIGGYAIHLSQK